MCWWKGHQKRDPPSTAPATVSPESAKSEAPPADTTQEQRNSGRKYPWTQLHSFYALMGGFAFDNSGHTDSYPLPDGRTRVTLSPQGLLFLTELRPDVIPDIPESSIRDKSKSEGIAKVVAFWQALWFVAQFITRVSQGLHVSLLELNTILHVVCASVAYFVFWFHKPLDIMQSTLISLDNDDTASICAAMTSVSAIGAWLPELRTSTAYYMRTALDMNDGLVSGRVQGVINLISSPALETGEYVLERPVLQDPRLKVSDMPVVQQPEISISQLPAACVIHYRGENLRKCLYLSSLGWFKGLTRHLSSVWSALRDSNQKPNTENREQPRESGEEARSLEEGIACIEDATITMGNANLRRQYQALQGFAAYPKLYHPRIEDLVCRRASNLGLAFDSGSTMRTLFATITAEALGLVFSSDRGNDQDKYWAYCKNAVSRFVHSSWVSVLGFLLASTLYGGAHLLLGWNGPMNTETEVLLWRLSDFALFGPWAFLFARFVLYVATLILFLLLTFSLAIVGTCLISLPIFLLLPIRSCIPPFHPPEQNSSYISLHEGICRFVMLSILYLLLSISVLTHCCLCNSSHFLALSALPCGGIFDQFVVCSWICVCSTCLVGACFSYLNTSYLDHHLADRKTSH